MATSNSSFPADTLTFTKTADPDGSRGHDELDLEVAGLQWLAEPMADGGAHTVPVISHTSRRLTLPRIREVHVTPQAAYNFGRALAVTHSAGAPHFGCAPATINYDSAYGRARQSITAHSHGTSAPTYQRWGEWFANERIRCMIAPARNNGSLSSQGVKAVETLAERINDGDFDADQPALVKGPVARLHGDLWCGNVLWAAAEDITWAPPQAGNGPTSTSSNSSHAEDIVGTLIDPMSHGGHAESDLAQLGVFGQRYEDEIYAGYQEVSPLADGWQDRRGISQLQMILMHAAIFGGAYGDQSEKIARHYCG